ncbi:MAG: PP2C family protein-serine/threonine phosphatase [Pirellulales bacterium]
MTPEPANQISRTVALERLLEVARRLGATVDLDAMLSAIVDAATDLLNCERATVFLYDATADELCSRIATGIEGSPISEIRFPANRGLAGEVARTGQVVNLPDAYADPRFNSDVDKTSGFRTRSMLAVRLVDHDDATVGVLQLLNKRTGPFDARDEEIAGFLGSQAGVAIQRQQLLDHYAQKQKIERDLSIACSIQQGLLPQANPTFAGFDIAGWNRPADETGGDFYDFLELDHRGLAVLIADVTGHGIGPALIMTEARALFRAALLGGDGLDRAVADVQRLLSMDVPEGRFVTAFCGLLSPTGALEFLNAAQGPTLLYSSETDRFEELPTHGLPLALIPEAEYRSAERRHLGDGDMLVMLTDGFYEYERADGESFGNARVEAAIRRLKGRPAEEIVRGLAEDVAVFAGGAPQRDDLTAVICKRCIDSSY